MDRPAVLARLNGRVLAVFSARTVTALRLPLPLQALSPRLEAFLRLNVAKEAQKDALVIRRAAVALGAGEPPGDDAVQALLAASKEVDRLFFERIGRFLAAGIVGYGEIAPVRAQRVERMLSAAYRILGAWEKVGTLRDALHASCPPAELEALARDLLQLYALETRAVTRALRLPVLLAPLRERFADHLFGAMEAVAGPLARDLGRTVTRRPRGVERMPPPIG